MLPVLRIILVAGIFHFAASTLHAEPDGRENAVLLVASGSVEVQRLGAATWSPANTNQVLNIRDRLRTGKNSRAAILLSNLSVLRVYELTTLEIQDGEKPGEKWILDLKAGATYFFHRDKPTETRFRTPTASGAIRGTEFNLSVAPNNRTDIALLDGEVELSNPQGTLKLGSGEQGVVEENQAPRKTSAVDAINIIQWTLYYPGVLNPDDLPSPLDSALEPSLGAYRRGDLLSALSLYPTNRKPVSESERIYHASLLLSAGQVEEAQRTLQNFQESKTAPLAGALRQLIAAVKHEVFIPDSAPKVATEFLAASYYSQSRSQLSVALELAREAWRRSPQFGFAAARVAELEFGFGNNEASLRALDRAKAMSSANPQVLALNGFVLSAHNQWREARRSFDDAIALDGSLANAWLGRGLIKIHDGDGRGGRQDLQVAAALEPNRALLRSYLGKAYSHTSDSMRAEKELQLARQLDPHDPTSWLYSALLHEQDNRVNEAVRDLEKSEELNDNRSLFRSRFLLDQDRAVRGANLAAIYRDAGMTDVSVREASRAVNSDYANYSAHLFLAESYDQLRDPKQINLRYETPWLSELLIANLLAPVGAGTLSQNVSQQEYSRLFEGNRFGFSSQTEYFSSGDWIQTASQFGSLGNASYALDAYYRSENGQRPNNDFRDIFLSAKIKEFLTPQDSIYIQATVEKRETGDVLQYYSQKRGSTTQRVEEEESPNVYAGFTHQWSPEHRTLLLVGRLTDELTIRDSNPTFLFLRQIGGATTSVETPPLFSLNYERELTAYSAEIQHIWQAPRHSLVVGGRYQNASVEATNTLTRPTGTIATPAVTADLWRLSAYGYYAWDLLDNLRISAGLTYDRLHFPENVDTAPVSSGERELDKVSPKFGIEWAPAERTHLRGAYTRSLGGVFFDNSVRLEPTQMAGFNQAFRSLAPESVVGIVPGTEFETAGIGLDHSFKSHTYFLFEGEWLSSSGERTLGVLTNSTFIPVPDRPSGTRQSVDFEERTAAVTVNQLLGDEWSIGARYRLSFADLETRLVDVSTTTPGAARVNQDESAALQQLILYAIYNHRSGFFAQAQSIWNSQSNQGYTPNLPGDDFWQANAFVGYRFPRRHAELRVGVLNLTDQNYELNPLTLYAELPRERTLTFSLKLNF